MLGLLDLRIFEATSVDVADLGEEHGHRVLRVCGKGSKVVLVPLPPAVGRAIDRAVGARPAGPILLNSCGARRTGTPSPGGSGGSLRRRACGSPGRTRTCSGITFVMTGPARISTATPTTATLPGRAIDVHRCRESVADLDRPEPALAINEMVINLGPLDGGAQERDPTWHGVDHLGTGITRLPACEIRTRTDLPPTARVRSGRIRRPGRSLASSTATHSASGPGLHR